MQQENMENQTAGNVFFDENKRLIFSCNKCASKFERQIDFEAHVQAHVDLDVNCFDAVLKHLSPNDLVTFAKVCNQFNENANRYVNKHNKTKSVGIYVYESGIRFKWRYELFFRKEIFSVHVYFHCTPTTDVFTFIKENCAKRLITFGLTYCGDIEGDIDDTHIEIIEEQLKNVEQLYLEDIKIADIHSILLEKCKNLHSLAITRSNTIKSNENYEHSPCSSASKRFKRMEEPKKWIDSPCENHFSELRVSEKYPKLKVLTFLTTNTIQWYDAEKFIYRNNGWRNYVDRDFQIFKDICHSKVRLSVRVFTHNLTENPMKLHNFGDIELVASEIDHFKHLEVVQLLGNICGIHTNVRTLSAIIRANIIFTDLKTLCVFPFNKNVCCEKIVKKGLDNKNQNDVEQTIDVLNNKPSTDEELFDDEWTHEDELIDEELGDEELQVSKLDRCFPNLTELFIHEAIVDIKSIFSHFKQLKIFVCNSTDIGAYNLFELNCARAGLKDAKKLTLFNCDDLLKKKTTHYTLPVNALVEINSNDKMRCICEILLN